MCVADLREAVRLAPHVAPFIASAERQAIDAAPLVRATAADRLSTLARELMVRYPLAAACLFRVVRDLCGELAGVTLESGMSDGRSGAGR